MTSVPPRFDSAELLAHVDWVRALAHRLVGDPNLAEDLAQETWLAARRGPPPRGSSARAWLHRILRNRMLQDARTSQRRSQRERAAARPEALPSTAELVERAACQRALVGHVLALDEPLRDAILLHYFEKLTAAQIAKRLVLPPKTVHSRLARGHAKLRERLERRHGDASWSLALAPILAGREVSAALPTSLVSSAATLIVNTQAKLALLSIALLAGGFSLYRVVDSKADASPARPAADAPLERATSEVVAARSAPESGPAREAALERSNAAAADAQAAGAAAEGSASYRVRGRVVDVEGRPIAGAAIARQLQLDVPVATSAPDGSFAVEVSRADQKLAHLISDSACLWLTEPGWFCLQRACVRESAADEEHVIVGTRAIAFEGSVVGRDALPIEGAELELLGGGTTFHGFPYALDRSSQVTVRTRTDAAGHFAVDRFPAAPGLLVEVSAPGFESRVISLDGQLAPYVFELTSEREGAGTWIEGVVLAADGAPAPGAAVRLGDHMTLTDDRGRFGMSVQHVDPKTPLCATLEGHLPALLLDFGARIEGGESGESIELVLGGAPLAIRGRVVDADGEPCSGCQVWLADETVVSQNRVPFDSAESLARGATPGKPIKTRRDGSFVLDGLYPREYELHAIDGESLQRAVQRVAAGDAETLVVVETKTRGPLVGSIVDRHGRPVVGLQVQLSAVTTRTPAGHMSIGLPPLDCDELGRFDFGRVPLGELQLSVLGEQVLHNLRTVPVGPLDEPLAIGVNLRCHFRVELSDPQLATSFRLVDEEGGAMPLNLREAFGMVGYSEGSLVEGRSETLSTSDSAAALVLLREGEEVARVVITLQPGETTLISE